MVDFLKISYICNARLIYIWLERPKSGWFLAFSFQKVFFLVGNVFFLIQFYFCITKEG